MGASCLSARAWEEGGQMGQAGFLAAGLVRLWETVEVLRQVLWESGCVVFASHMPA